MVADKKLRKLNRTELLEMLVAMKKELDRVSGENESLQKKLNDNEEAQKKLMQTLQEMSVKLDGLCKAMNVQTDIDSESKTDE